MADDFNVTYDIGDLGQLDLFPEKDMREKYPALKQAYEILAPDGKISVIAYRGHPGGREEFENVENYINKMNWKFKKSSDCNDSDSPVLFILSKN